MADKKNTILLCNDDYEPIEWLSIDQKGRLLDAIFKYSIYGSEDVDEDIRVAFLFLRKRIDRHNEAYEKTCAKRREAGEKGGKRRVENQANASKPKQMQANASKPKQTQADKDKDKDKDKDRDRMFSNENDIDISSGIASNSSSNPKSDAAVAESRKSKLEDVTLADSIIDLYNRRVAETGCRLRSCVAKSQKRRGMLLARLREHGEENVRAVIEKAVASHFLNYGTRNGEPMDIEWIFGRDNFLKVLEGKYDDRDRASPQQPAKERLKSPIPEYTDEEWNRLHLWEQDDAVHKHYGI